MMDTESFPLLTKLQKNNSRDGDDDDDDDDETMTRRCDGNGNCPPVARCITMCHIVPDGDDAS